MVLLQNPLLSTHFLTSQDQILCRHVARVPSFFLPPSFRDSCASNDWFTNIFVSAPSISISPPPTFSRAPRWGVEKKKNTTETRGGRGYAMNNGGISYTRQICYSKEYLLFSSLFFFFLFFFFLSIFECGAPHTKCGTPPHTVHLEVMKCWGLGRVKVRGDLRRE